MSRNSPGIHTALGSRIIGSGLGTAGCLAAGALAISAESLAAPVTVEWTGTVRTVDSVNFPPDTPLFRELESLVAVGDSARYRLTYDDEAVTADPDSVEPDPFEPRAAYSDAVTDFELDVRTLVFNGRTGRLRVESSPNRRERGVSYFAAVTHDVLRRPDAAPLADTKIVVSGSDSANGNDGNSFGVELADAIGVLLVVPDDAGPDSLSMSVDLDRVEEGQFSSAILRIDFDASSVSEVPLPPALAMFVAALVGLWRYPRRSV